LLLTYLMGGTLLEQAEAYRLGSPVVHVGAHCPPTLLLHGEEDIIINPSQSRRMHQALCDAGAISIYIEIPKAVHAFDQYFGVSRRLAPAAQSATYDVERFLALMV
jgi:acetyl esterase/lipase